MLDLSNNYLRCLKCGVFKELTGLEELLLCNNQLRDLDRDIFVLAPVNWHVFDAESGEIRSDWVWLSSLREIDLSGNKLSELDAAIFEKLNNLRILVIYDNPLSAETIQSLREKLPHVDVITDY